MNDALLTIAGRPVAAADLVPGLLGLGTLAVLLVLVAVWRAMGRARRAEARAEDHARMTDERLAEMTRLQSETAGRMAAIADSLGHRQQDLARAVSERLDGLTHRLGRTLAETSRATNENLGRLSERMAVIDRAQKTLGDLTGEMLELKSILSDKQARGAWGQGRMEAIIADALPAASYRFQATLSNGTRPDCLVLLPNGAAPLAIDAKFPLEGWTAFRDADTPEERAGAEAQLRRDVTQHIKAIRDKYLLPGETQETAFLFVPSEALFADLNEHFDDLVQRAHRARVVIVSPTLLLLAIQVVQAVIRDHRMREEAHRIQAEVGLLLDDVDRLVERVEKLGGHFGQASKDIEQIVVSADKIARRGARIEDMDLGAPPAPETPQTPARAPSPVLARLAGE